MPLAGGIIQNGYQCGMIWGAALAAGAQAYHLSGSTARSEAGAILASQKIVESFQRRNKHINCLEITNLDKSSSTMQMIKFFLIKGGPIRCIRMAGRYARVAADEIESALADTGPDIPEPPISCAALLARKMGVSDMHAVMTAGLAGGIGLCGGACGALGAAVWITAMNCIEKRSGKLGFSDPDITNVVDRFLAVTDYKFECSEIVGRKFENIGDHAGYMRNGGCAEIIDTLAAR